jgi:hypothetical protein
MAGTDAVRTLKKGGHMNADRKPPAIDDPEARARRSRRIHAFLHRWAKLHMPVRVTRFPRR